ncbi:MAG: hypothetical protein KDD40_06630, partial [Bdellovibrionales bacterium]|nr:hypothetical protein [Bdellovibrionales bacterium]
WDDLDRAFDLKMACNLNPPIQPRESTGEIITEKQTQDSLIAIQSEYSLPLKSLKANVITAKYFKPGKLVILRPESHLHAQSSARDIKLHQSLIHDDAQIIEHFLQRGENVLNSIEGINSLWRAESGLFKVSVNNRQQLIHKYTTELVEPAGDLIAEIYHGWVTTIFNEPINDFVKYLIVHSLYFINKKEPIEKNHWSKIVEKIRSSFPVYSQEIDFTDYVDFYNSLQGKDQKELNQLHTTLCEQRSKNMALNTLENMQNVNVSIMHIGAKHVHGIIVQLEKHSINYLVLSPNI